MVTAVNTAVEPRLHAQHFSSLWDGMVMAVQWACSQKSSQVIPHFQVKRPTVNGTSRVSDRQQTTVVFIHRWNLTGHVLRIEQTEPVFCRKHQVVFVTNTIKDLKETLENMYLSQGT